MVSAAARSSLFFPAVGFALEHSGSAFVKWGQWAATRPDLLPTALCDELSRLHAHAPAHDASFTRRAVEAAVGSPLEVYFDAFDLDAPFASGSIGQLHRAVLHSSGAIVAVKVRHPYAADELRADFALLEGLATAVDMVPGLGWLDARSTVRQFGWALQRQADLDDEAASLRAVSRNFRGWSDVEVPAVVLSSPGVLIESLVPGRPIGEYIHFGQPTASAHDSVAGRRPLDVVHRHYIVQRGVDIYYKMLLDDNLMHADLHPGNLLFEPTARHGAGSISIVDLGLVAVLTDDEKHNFIGFLQAIGDGDGTAAARRVLGWGATAGEHSGKHSSGGEQDEARRRAFIAAMADAFTLHCRGYGRDVDLGVVLRLTLSLMREHRVPVGANYMTLVINAMCLEGMARQLVPEYNVMDGAKPLLRAHAGLPRILFRAVSPLARLVKRMHDRAVLRTLQRRGTASQVR